MEIKGTISKLMHEKDDFKIYSFIPSSGYEDKVRLSSYGNIVIKGNLPIMIENKEYTLEVQYEKYNNRESYNVEKFINDITDMTETEISTFLSKIIGVTRTCIILKEYPNFFDMIINEDYSAIDFQKLKGIGEKSFEKMKVKIAENIKYMKVMSYFSSYNLSESQIKKLYAKFSSFELLKEKMIKTPYRCLCSISGISFKTADSKILQNSPELRSSKQRMSAAIRHILLENESKGHTWMHQSTLYSSACELVSESMPYYSDVVDSNNTNIYYDGNRVSRAVTYNCEKEIAEMLKNLLKNSVAWKCDTSMYKNVNTFQLSYKQSTILDLLCNNNIAILSGYGGTGKTMSCIALTNMLTDLSKTFLLLAPTGKASKVLGDYTNIEAKTIHRGLGYMGDSFEYNEHNKLDYDCIIADEGSMIDIWLMHSLLSAIDTTRTKIIFVCDTAQIPSVGCGNCIQNMVDCGKIPMVLLDEVFRYKEGGLAKVATCTRNGVNFLDLNCTKNQQVFGANKDFVFIEKSEALMVNEVLRIYNKLLSAEVDKNDIMILSAYNKGQYGTYRINSLIQDLINPLNGREEISFKKDGETVNIRVGDKVMETKNKYDIATIDKITTNIYNGDEGTVMEISDDCIVIDFEGKVLEYSLKDSSSLLLSYVISMHKSQGSQKKKIIVITPPAHAYFLNRNLLYVAYSRAKENVYHVGNRNVVASTLRKCINTTRNTWLQELL